MLYVPAYTHERRPYLDTLYPTALTLTLSRPSRSVPSARLMIGASPRAPWFVWHFSRDYIFWDERGGRLTGQPIGPQVDTETITTLLSTNRVNSKSFSSRCWAFRRTHTSTDTIWLLCIRLSLPLTLSLPSGFAPSARLMVCVYNPGPYGLWGIFRVTVRFGTRGEKDLLGNRSAHRRSQQPLEQQ